MDNNNFDYENEKQIDGNSFGSDTDNAFGSEVNSNVTLSENQGEYKQPKVKADKDGLWSMICGLILIVLNCVMIGLDRVFIGWLLIVLPIFGVVKAVSGIKMGGAQRIMGIFGIILNVIGALGLILLVGLAILSKFL